MNKLQHYASTSLHKLWVIWYALKTCKAILIRALKHDLTKYSGLETAGFIRSSRLRTLAYGTPEYYEELHKLNDTLEHHYLHNKHHPEHYKNGVQDMSPLDIIEMLIDWKASTHRVKDGSIHKSVYDVGMNRFKYNITTAFQYMRFFKEIKSSK